MSQRVKLTAYVTLSDGTDPCAWADSVFEFLEDLSDPAPLFVHGVTSDVVSDRSRAPVWKQNLDHPIGTEEPA